MFILNEMKNMNFFPGLWSLVFFLNCHPPILGHQNLLLCYLEEDALFYILYLYLWLWNCWFVYITSYSKLNFISPFVLVSVFYVWRLCSMFADHWFKNNTFMVGLQYSSNISKHCFDCGIPSGSTYRSSFEDYASSWNFEKQAWFLVSKSLKSLSG